MAIFENEVDINLQEPVSSGNPLLASPQITQLQPYNPVNPTYSPAPQKDKEGMNGEELSKFSKTIAPSTGGFNSPLQTISRKELLDNQRYPLYTRSEDLENIYGNQQSWYDRLGNGLLKFGATGVGTFVQSFATIPNTVAAIQNGSMAELAGDPEGYEASVDKWLKNLEDNFPNYYTRYEREHPFRAIIPFTKGSANFWGDKVIKNLGFTAGAIAGAIVQDLAVGAVTGGIGDIPLVASQVGKASLWLNKVFTGANRIDDLLVTAGKLGATEQRLLNIKRLGEMAALTKITSGVRYGTTLYGSARTEAAIEARDSYEKVKEELTAQYKLDNLGDSPTGGDLDNIDSYAEDAMNTRFGVNMALLSISNAVQFGNLFKSFNVANRALSSVEGIGLKAGSLDTFEKIVPVGTGAKVWESVRPKISNVFTEGVFEEGGQFATERGVYDYYTRKYKHPTYKGEWDNVNETITSTLEGLKQQFGNTEGIENMVIGGITAMIAGGITNRIESSRGTDINSRQQSAINILNQYGLTGTLSQQYKNTLDSAIISKEMQDAVVKKDVYAYQNLKSDMFFNFVMSRIPSGMHDTTVEQLGMLKDLPKEEFEKTFGMDFSQGNIATVGEYVDGMIQEANDIKKINDGLDIAFRNPFKKNINPQTPEDAQEQEKYNLFNEWKINLAYYASQAKSVNNRISDIQQSVSAINPGISIDLLSRLSNATLLEELSNEYEQTAESLSKTITEFTPAADRRRIRDQVKALNTHSEKIGLALAGQMDEVTFNQLLNFELNGQVPGDRVVSGESAVQLFNFGVDVNRLNSRKEKASEMFDALSTEEGFNDFFEQEQNLQKASPAPLAPTETPQFTNELGKQENIELNREYALETPLVASVKKINDRRWEVTSPDGKSWAYRKTKKAAEELAKDQTEEYTELGKVKVLAINPDGTIKIEDTKGDIYDIPSTRISGYQRVITEQEKLQKSKADLDREQSELEKESGTVSTNSPEQDSNSLVPEDKKKLTLELFTSTTSASEDWEAGGLKPHVVRTNAFLNNAKNLPNFPNLKTILVTQNQETSLGLGGLVDMSLDGSGLDKTKYTNVNEGLVAAVYVEQEGDGLYFVDSEGKRISKVGEQADLNRVVFSTMPSTHLFWSDGKTPRYRNGERDEAMQQAKAWEAKRKQLFSNPEGKYETYNFSISRGIPVISDTTARNPVGDNLIPENKISTQEGLIFIPTTGVVPYKGNLLKYPNGRPVLMYGDTVQFINNSRFTKAQAKGIFEVMKALSEDVKNQSGKKIKLNRKYTKFLQNTLYWRKSAQTANNQIFIDTTSMDFFFGGERYDLTNIAAFEKQITEKLENVYFAVNNTTLSGQFNVPFTEYYFEKDKLATREWKNYQTFLLSSKTPDGKKRSDIPLTTSTDVPTAAVPSNFKQKYAILEGFELPVESIPTPKPVEVKKEVAKETKPTIGKYIVDGTTKNTFSLKNGDVEFTATVDNKAVSVEVEANPVIEGIAANTALMKVVVETLKSSNRFDATKENVQLATEFVALRIAVDLQKQLDEAPVTPIAPPEVVARQEAEQKKEVKIDVKTKDVTKTSAPPNTEYARTGNSTSVPRISAAEIDLFKEWHSKNVPNIPYEIMENILITHDGEKAWGAFENNVAKFYKSGQRGTEYHEIFEGIWASMLTSEEQQALLDEFKSKPGQFTDRASGKKISFDEATDLQAKERIADDFAEFKTGHLPARSLGERIVRFFRAIIKFFEQFSQKPSKKEQLFKDIDTGEFKDVVPTPTNNPFSEYKRVEGLSEQQANEFVEDISARFFQNVFGTTTSLYSPELMTAPKIFSKIKEAYEAEGKLEAIGETTWNQLVKRTKEFLRTFKIEFDDSEALTINEESADKTLYAPEPFATNWKKSSPFPVKLLLGTLTETVPQNQENSLSLDLPQQKLSGVNGYKLLNFSRAFSTVMEKLANTTHLKKVVSKLADLAKFDSNYVRLFTRLKGNRDTIEVDFSKFKPEDWRLFINFYQTFTKQKPNAYIQYVNAGEVYSAPANLSTAIKTEQSTWIENMKGLSKKKDSVIKYNSSTKTYQIGNISTIPIKTPQEQTKFLSKLGIEFPMEVYNRLSTQQRAKFSTTVASIHKYFGSNQDVLTLSGQTTGVNGQLTTLAELLVRVTNPNQDMSYFGIDGKRMQNFADNNAISIFENDFNSADTLEDLLQIRPELRDVFSTNSQVLKLGGIFFDQEGKRIKSLKVGYIQGTANVDTGRETTTSALSLGDRYTQEINQNLNGNYYVLIPADSSTEWMIDLGNTVSFEDVEVGDSWGKIFDIFKGYLKDDILLSKEDKSYLKNVGTKSKNLRFFGDILPSALIDKASTLISEEDIDLFIAENSEEINTAIQNYVAENAISTIESLKSSNQIDQMQSDTFAYSQLDDNFAKKYDLNKYELSEKEVNDIITFANVNYIINNIELHKVLFGDPYQFAIKGDQLDETKRIKSFLSPRRTTFDSPEFNTFLNQNYNKAGDIVLTEEDPGYHLHKSYANTVTLQDIEVGSSTYSSTNEADAASWIMDNSYREVKLKNAQWSEEAEAWHQWQMAYTRQHMPGYEYSNKALEKYDIELLSSPEPKFVTEVLKPIVSGEKFGKGNIDLVLDKFSQMPIYYSFVEGTNLENLYTKMWKENIDYAVMISGRKVGAEKLHNLYNEDGSFNTEPFNNLIQVTWKSYGIQVENSYDKPKEQTRGSQLTKLSSLDLYNNGKASEAAQKEYKKNVEILNKIHINAYRNLLNSLGIEDLDGSFKLIDNSSVSQVLQRELLSREASENLKDVVQLDDEGNFRIPFEASSAYLQIKDILYSMVDKAIVSPKMSGGAHVQVPVTMWENAKEGRKVVKINGKDVFTSSRLKFYTKDAPYCEVLLPAWFKDKINKKRFKTDQELIAYLNKSQEGKEILKGIGFRIPTQSLSSIEVFRVAGFLPASMGNTVVVPSEITTKAGSDFDIDKLNMYLKAVFIDMNGDIKPVKYKGSEEATKEYYGNLFDKKLEKQKIKKPELLEALQILNWGLDDPKNLIAKYGDILDSIVQESDNSADAEEKLLQKIEQLGDDNLQAGFREDFVNLMYKRSLENEYYDSLERLITLPENYERLISPVGDAGLKAVSVQLDKLRNVDESSIKNRILSRDYMTSTRHAFVTGKKWVGVAAVNITGHSLTQKSEIFIDPARFELIPDFDAKILDDGSIALPHNTTEDGNTSISGIKTADGKEYISDRLSGYATSFVDVAKDPYILKIIKSDLAIGTFMFLERIGAGKNTALFMNQPIIDEYLSFLDSINARSLYSKSNLDYIKGMFPASKEAIATAKIDVNSLSSNIEKYNGKELSENDNSVQQKILSEFLKYAKMAEYSFDLTQATNYDTTKFRSQDSLFKKNVRTEIARRINIFSSVDKMLNSSFIGEQSFILSYASEAMGEILKLDQYALREQAINPILRPFAANKYLSSAKYDTIANKVVTSFIDYLVQTQSGINGLIEELLVNKDTNVAGQLAVAKEKYPQLRILKDLQIVSSDRPDGAKSIKLKANLKDAYDENLYTEMMRELRDFPGTQELYYNIVSLSVLQGTGNSPISIANIIPVEDRSAIIAPVINQLSMDDNFQIFAQGAFQRNNWKNDDVFREIHPKFFSQEVPLGEDQFGNEIYQYISPAFPGIQTLGIKPSDRKILLVNEKYNSFQVSSDFLKVPKVVQDAKTGERINMENGRTVTNSMFVQRKAKGDMSLKDVYGYKKVKYSNGKPVLTFDKDGNSIYIYKLINLWGDGMFAAEYYEEGIPSVLDNGTVKIATEIPDADIINFYAPVIAKTVPNTTDNSTNQIPNCL